jgi:hypothetical protein
MKLQEVFDQLSAGEFSQLSIGGAAAGVIDETNYSKVIGHVNLGLTALYRRFNLKTGNLVLRMEEDRYMYQLHSSMAVSKGGTYLIDTVLEPFLDDIIKVERVVDEVAVDLPLNDAADSMSVFTPSSLRLSVPIELTLQDLLIVYRADHPKIVVGDSFMSPEDVELELPPTHLEALLYYVASRVNNPIGMNNEFHAGNSYAAKYEMVCKQLEEGGLQVDKGESNSKIYRGGWS